MQQRAAGIGFEVDGDAALVAVESAEEASSKADQPPGRIARHRLDLDHVGAEVGEDQARARTHDGVAEFEHADAGKGQGAVGIGLSVSHWSSLSRHGLACPAYAAGTGPALPIVRP